ncbi:MAG TPA: ribonuclease R [Blastocatellia bacterium]|nr:ribonuclease R [Blastocatellia bacterium]
MLRLTISPQRVLEAIPDSADHAVDLAEIARSAGVNPSLEPTLKEYLSEFARVRLIQSRGNRYWRVKTTNLVIGTLSGTKSGHAFVVPDDPVKREQGDLHINRRRMGAALHGDRVIARVVGRTRRGLAGKIEAVLWSTHRTVVGRLFRAGPQCFVSPMDERFLHEINVTPANRGYAEDGDIVVVEITVPADAGRSPWGRVVEVLGTYDTPGIDLQVIIRQHNLPLEFPDDVLQEGNAIEDHVDAVQLEGRIDLRNEITVTIDGETARDFDDAVSLKTLPNGRLQLGVHIADVGYYVSEGSRLDEEAFRRGTSVYFPEHAIPMLPERLSNGICSLNPRVDRLTMSVLAELDLTGRIVDYRLAPTVIRSNERMTYTAVNEILQNPQGPESEQYSQVKDMLVEMHKLALVLIERREKRGAIDFNLPEAELLFNDEGQIGGIVRSERNIAHRLIEEFMLLANETVATHLDSLGVPLLYRIHEEPNILKVEEFAEIAASFGHKFSMHGPVPQRGFQHLAKQIAGTPQERMLSYLMLRSMQRARYTPRNEGHFGLAMTTYTHFTSPIRRYPDLVVHRILREVLEQSDSVTELGIDPGKKQALNRISAALLSEERETQLRRTLEFIGEHSSERERDADEAERELMDWRRAEFMAGQVGQRFGGVISSVHEYGFFVELIDVFVEGLVHVATLTDDLYLYEERKHRLVGQRSGKVFRLGDVVEVLVDRVDRARHKVDFSVA